jgi:hypothetical protein
MKIAVMAGLLAERDMEVDAAHTPIQVKFRFGISGIGITLR